MCLFRVQDLTEAVDMEFKETSAREDINVKELFLMLASSILSSDAVEESSSNANTITITSSAKKQTDGGKKCC